MNTALPFIFALYPLCLAGVALAWLCRARAQGPFPWAATALAGGSVIAFAFLTGPWPFTSYYLRYLVAGLYVWAVTASYRRLKRVGRSGPARKVSALFSLPVLLLFAVLDVLAAASHHESGEALDLSFPLTAGTYCVLQGGSSLVTNPFHGLGGSKYAVDIVKLNALGNRAAGIAPPELSAYGIFGETLHSPCSGMVLSVRDSLPDNPPAETDAGRPEGNHVVMECAGARVLMAHLMAGSIRVTPGEAVTEGEPVARVGNSGNSLEPHLHIDAKKGEAAMPLRFNGRQLSVNSVVRRQ